ncbi:MAG: hypothetical protein BK997_02335 [Candidatus Micrarchaeum sp. ARMAN-1]|nr:MAG: hypothetical protein BK997_02335 [Candidatus Micrarchaeum sp. ARMAN-1]
MEKLKKGRKYSAMVLKIHGSYYVYEYKDWIDRQTKRRHSERLYIGKIEENGTFVAKERSKLPGKPINLEQYMKMKYKDTSFITDKATVPDSIDSAVLTAMSMDGRASASDIAKSIGIKSYEASYRMEKLRKEYSIRPTINIRPTTFGFSRFLILAKFINGRPSAEKLKVLLENEQRVQLVLLMKGDYDLAIYVIAEDIPKLENMVYKIRSNTVFSNYRSVWNVSYLYEAFGWFVLTRDVFFELIKDRVWQKSKESPKKLHDQLFKSEYAVMRELSKDCSINFSDIDKAYGLNEGSAQYTYHKLLERKTIEGATICMQEPHCKYSALIYIEQEDVVAFNKTKKAYFKNVISEGQRPTNRFAYIADTSSPYGIITLAPIYTDDELEEMLGEFREQVKGITIKYSIITNQLLGNIGFRRYDMKTTGTYKIAYSEK